MIRGYRALIDPVAVGRGLRVFAGVRLMRHVTGNYDYLLQVEVADLAAYEDFHASRLASLPGVAMVNRLRHHEDALPRRYRLDELDLGLIWLVVDEVVAGRAVPAGLDRGAARGVAERLRLVGVPGPPVRQQAEGSG